MGNILVFTKKSKEYRGLLRSYRGNLFFAEKNNGSASFTDIVEIETFLSRVRPAHVYGYAEQQDSHGIVIHDAVELLNEKDPNYFARAADELAALAGKFYFVPVKEPLSGNEIEEEIARFLASDTLSSSEREHILKEMKRMDEKQLLLLHFLIKRLDFAMYI